MSPQPRLIVFMGGLRSGKSRAAQDRFMTELEAWDWQGPAYFATLLAPKKGADADLARRIALHQDQRPAGWATVEVGLKLEAAAKACLAKGLQAWLLDGAGAWAALRLEQEDATVLGEWEDFLKLARRVPLAVLVLDEVGQGGVSGHPVARRFADLNGRLNQVACAAADEVYAVQAGLLQRLK